jgi:hypothetical protein
VAARGNIGRHGDRKTTPGREQQLDPILDFMRLLYQSARSAAHAKRMK